MESLQDRYLNHTQLNCSYFCLFEERIQINIKIEMGQVKYYFCLL